jgi:dTDP-4-amino-4,6-dideoxygalactose transaminase
MSDKPPRLLLATPHMSGTELDYVREAFDTNWIAPLGPHVDAFEREFADYVGAPCAAALNSGTAAVHLALILAGVKPGDTVIVSDFTFIASVSPVVWLGAEPIFVDSDYRTWNIDPVIMREALQDLKDKGKPARAAIITHLYGLSADLDPIVEVCEEFGVVLIEDAAEALGVTYHEKHVGLAGRFGIFSFNGNKIITTSGGGMLVGHDEAAIERARFLSTQARDPAPHYEHSVLGFNYRLSNVLAGIGRGQLKVIEQRVARKREIFAFYRNALNDLPGVRMMPSPEFARNSHWLTCITIDRDKFGADREQLRRYLDETENIEARPLWKPMHLQPVFSSAQYYGSTVAENLFDRGLCLPSGSNIEQQQLHRVTEAIKVFHRKAGSNAI